MKLHIARLTGFEPRLFCWSVVMPLSGRGTIEASWFDPRGVSPLEIKRHAFGMSPDQRLGTIAAAKVLPKNLGYTGMDDMPQVSIGVEEDEVITWSTLMICKIPDTNDVRAFNSIVDRLWPEIQAALDAELRPHGLIAGHWRDGLSTLEDVEQHPSRPYDAAPKSDLPDADS